MALYSTWLLRRICRKESRNALVVVSGFLVKRYCLPTEPEDVFTGLVGTPVSDLLEPIGAGVRQTLRQLSLTRRIVRCVLGRGRLKLAQVNLFHEASSNPSGRCGWHPSFTAVFRVSRMSQILAPSQALAHRVSHLSSNRVKSLVSHNA